MYVVQLEVEVPTKAEAEKLLSDLEEVVGIANYELRDSEIEEV
jgi:indole-3-glycerol phosphate synthase